MTMHPSENNKQNQRSLSRRKFFIGLAVVLIAIAMSIAAIEILRTPAPQAAPVTRSVPPLPPTDPKTAEDYIARGDYAFDQGKYDAAITAYSRAIELGPDLAQAYNNRAYAYMTIQKYDLALPDLDTAIRLRPDYVNALMNRGDIHNYYYQIDRARAIADYDRVLELDPDAPNYTSVCGHRMLAIHDGWSPTIYVEILQHGIKSGCPENINLQ